MLINQRKVVFTIIKIAAVVISLSYIVYHINSRASLIHDSERLLNRLSERDSRYRIAAILSLMFINYFLETEKWRMLISSVENVSFIKAARSVFTGATISFFTPNRVGEFAGRIVHLNEGHRIRGALAAFVGSSAQLLITIQAGLLALIIYAPDTFELSDNVKVIIIAGISISVILLMIAWFKIPLLSGFFKRNSYLEKYWKFTQVFSTYHRKELALTYLYSIARYIVFCSQQYLIFHAFGIDADYFKCFELSAVSFLLITLIPSIALGELGVRGGINLVVFAGLTTDSSAILIGTFTLWCVNLALPALLGAFSLLYIRLWKEDSD